MLRQSQRSARSGRPTDLALSGHGRQGSEPFGLQRGCTRCTLMSLRTGETCRDVETAERAVLRDKLSSHLGTLDRKRGTKRGEGLRQTAFHQLACTLRYSERVLVDMSLENAGACTSVAHCPRDLVDKLMQHVLTA